MATVRLEVERLGSGPPVLFVHGSVVGPELTWQKQRELAVADSRDGARHGTSCGNVFPPATCVVICSI